MSKLIVLDAGHGIETAGKRSPDGSLREYEFARDVVARIKTKLEAQGLKTLIICPTEKDVPINDRSKKANEAKADIFVSIHANAAGSGASWLTGKGYEVLVNSLGGQAEKLAKVISKQTIPLIKLTDRGVKAQNGAVGVLRDTKMPAVLVESAFMDNKDEVALLKSNDFREKIAAGTYRGVLEYFGITEATTPAIEDPTNTPSDWAKAAWEKVTALKIMDGTRPKDNVTRQELAQVLVNLEQRK